MASGARVDAEDRWLVGEDKRLVFTVTDDRGVELNATGWTAVYAMFSRRARPGASPLFSINVTGAGGVIVVNVPAANTAGLTAGTYEHVLRRVDEGNAAVLAYDSVELGAAP